MSGSALQPPVRVAVDVAVIALGEPAEGDDAGHPVLLTRDRPREPYRGVLSLPGGMLRAAEDLESAARRVLRDVAGLEVDPGGGVRHLEQLATFGGPDRDPRGRAVSVSYLALLPRPRPPAPGTSWRPLLALPPLAFDHDEIAATALHRLRGKLSYSTVASALLPDEFTLGELQAVYEVVLDRPLDKRNFRRRVTGLDLVVETGGVRRGPHRPAQLYRFRRAGVVVLDSVIF